MTELLVALVGALIIFDAFLIRLVWRLSNRLSRLEGRLNGRS